MTQPRLMVVDGDADVCELIEEVARRCGFDAARELSGNGFIGVYANYRPSVVVLALALPGLDGFELIRFLAARRSDAAILIISGQDPRILAAANRLADDLGLDVIGTLTKPISVEQLKASIERVRDAVPGVTEDELRQAIDSGELALHYQPQATFRPDGDAGDYQILGCEALARWQHPRLGLLAPGAFVPLAEKSGLIEPLTMYVFQQAVSQLARWRDAGLTMEVSVNLSPLLLTDLDIPARLQEMVEKAGLGPERVTVEVTETAATADVTVATEILGRLRLRGFGLSIDDFGTGYSSLVELYRLPFNELKIDICFVGVLDRDPEAQKMLRVIALLGKEFDLTLCAEGVETEDALRLLHAEGCQKVQGHLIGEPVEAARFEADRRVERDREAAAR